MHAFDKSCLTTSIVDLKQVVIDYKIALLKIVYHFLLLMINYIFYKFIYVLIFDEMYRFLKTTVSKWYICQLSQ